MGLSFTVAALVLDSEFILWSESRGTHDILLSQIRDFPNLGGQVPVFISPRNRVARLYPQALGFLFVVSYDSQGSLNRTPSVESYSLGADHTESTACITSSIVA
jgi:hypothetical protein